MRLFLFFSSRCEETKTRVKTENKGGGAAKKCGSLKMLLDKNLETCNMLIRHFLLTYSLIPKLF